MVVGLLFFSDLYSMNSSDTVFGFVPMIRQKVSPSPLRNKHTPLLEQQDEEIKSYEERFLIKFIKFIELRNNPEDIYALEQYLAVKGNKEFLLSICHLFLYLKYDLRQLRHSVKIYSDQNRSVYLSINKTYITLDRYKTHCDVVELNYDCSVDSPKFHSRVVLLFLSAILRKLPNKLYGDHGIVENGCYAKVFIR